MLKIISDHFFSIFILILILISTNRWMGWDAGIDFMYKPDVSLYVTIAETAPDLVFQKTKYHIAQRFFSPYVAGLVAKATPLSIPQSFTLLALLCTVGMLIYAYKIFEALQLKGYVYTLAWALLIWNPYLIRYHAIVPGTLQSLFFMFGFFMLINGLLRHRMADVFFAMIIAVLGRQTALLLIPGIFVWMVFEKSEQKLINKRLAEFCLLTVVTLGIYLFTGWVARLSDVGSLNFEHAVGIIPWVMDNGFQYLIIAELIFRSFMPNLMLLILVGFMLLLNRASLKQLPVAFWALLLMGFCVIAQPIMAGPEITGYPKGSGTRLGLLGLPAVCTAAAFILKAFEDFFNRMNPLSQFACIFSVFLGSIHHMYTWLGPSNVLGFLLLHCFSIVLLLTVLFLFGQKEQDVR